MGGVVAEEVKFKSAAPEQLGDTVYTRKASAICYESHTKCGKRRQFDGCPNGVCSVVEITFSFISLLIQAVGTCKTDASAVAESRLSGAVESPP